MCVCVWGDVPAENESRARRGCSRAGRGVAPAVGLCVVLRRTAEHRPARAFPGSRDWRYSSVLCTRAKERLGWPPGLTLVSLAHFLDFTPLRGLQRVPSALALTSPGLRGLRGSPQRQPTACRLCTPGLLLTVGNQTCHPFPFI